MDLLAGDPWLPSPESSPQALRSFWCNGFPPHSPPPRGAAGSTQHLTLPHGAGGAKRHAFAYASTRAPGGASPGHFKHICGAFVASTGVSCHAVTRCNEPVSRRLTCWVRHAMCQCISGAPCQRPVTGTPRATPLDGVAWKRVLFSPHTVHTPGQNVAVRTRCQSLGACY